MLIFHIQLKKHFYKTETPYWLGKLSTHYWIIILFYTNSIAFSGFLYTFLFYFA